MTRVSKSFESDACNRKRLAWQGVQIEQLAALQQNRLSAMQREQAAFRLQYPLAAMNKKKCPAFGKLFCSFGLNVYKESMGIQQAKQRIGLLLMVLRISLLLFRHRSFSFSE
jgi:hypothetical protein